MYSKELHQKLLDQLKERNKKAKLEVGKVISRIPAIEVVKNPQDRKQLFLQAGVKYLIPFVKETVKDGREFLKVKSVKRQNDA